MPYLSYEYEPYTQLAQDHYTPECEIPCFRIYRDHEEMHVAETNENLPSAVQEKYARLFVASEDLFNALEYFFNIMHDYENSLAKGYIEMAFARARSALAKVKGCAA